MDVDQVIQCGDRLGRGSFGVVKKVIWNNRVVAMKIYETESQKESMKIELRTLSRVNHDNIIQLLGFRDTAHPFLIIVEYAENGSLYDFLHPKRRPYYKYGVRHAVNWALQCAQGVAYLHSMYPPILHRDLKSPNLLLLEDRRRLKICDFGTARNRDLENMTNNTGTAAWMAPEVFQGKKYTEKCDVYSWGIIFWEVLSRKIPFEEQQFYNPDVLKYAACCNGARPSRLEGCPAQFENLYTECWQGEGSARPSMENVVLIMSRLLLCFTEDSPINEETENPSESVSFEGGKYDEVLEECFDEKLNPSMRPISPDRSSDKSLQIFEEHNKLVMQYFKMKEEMEKLTMDKERLDKALSKLTNADELQQRINKLESEKERLIGRKKRFEDQLLQQEDQDSLDELEWVIVPWTNISPSRVTSHASVGQFEMFVKEIVNMAFFNPKKFICP